MTSKKNSVRSKIAKAGLLVIACIWIWVGCFSSNRKLEKYYLGNPALHHELADSLMWFCRTYKTDLILRKDNYSPNKPISFSIYFDRSSDSIQHVPVYFDSAFNRQDYRPSLTGEFTIPLSIIKNFKNSIYFAVAADSTYTFFADTWNEKIGIGTRSDSQHGIRITSDTISKEHGKRIAENVFISDGFIP